VLDGEVSIVALANGWVTISVAGGPTDDKPNVTLEPPADPGRVSSFLNIRVADIAAKYQEWSARGAEFLTPPIDRGEEIRCYIGIAGRIHAIARPPARCVPALIRSETPLLLGGSTTPKATRPARGRLLVSAPVLGTETCSG
jgi:hypothetical protein